jgi:hypothetical protein
MEHNRPGVACPHEAPEWLEASIRSRVDE